VLRPRQHGRRHRRSVGDVRLPGRTRIDEEEQRTRQSHRAEDVGEQVDWTLWQEIRTLGHGPFGSRNHTLRVEVRHDR
jgi:hypothetical protein